MSQNQQNNDQPVRGVSWATKAGYIGTGVLVGLVIYPFVRKAVAKIQPKLDQVFDDLTGKAEDLAERTSDILARAKVNLRKVDEEEAHHEHGDDEEHDHDHDQGKTKKRKG